MKNSFLLIWAAILTLPLMAQDDSSPSYYLIGNSLTWDAIGMGLDVDAQWHVDCGKNLSYIYKNPQKPCVKSSTLWPAALKAKQYDYLSVQPHYKSTVEEDAAIISEWMGLQPKAILVIHTGWARVAEREKEWADQDASGPMQHSTAYFDALIKLLKKHHPNREVRRTQAMDLIQRVAADIEAKKAPYAEVAELHRDAIHMNLQGKYLMHNAVRHALGLPRSASKPFDQIDPNIRSYLDSVLDTLQ